MILCFSGTGNSKYSAKKLSEQFNESIPKELMILRNHIKNCYYCNSVSDFNFKYKTIEESRRREAKAWHDAQNYIVDYNEQGPVKKLVPNKK